MITSIGLQQLGFKSLNMVEDGDFRLQDDGAGTYIKEWTSASPQPSEAEIETAHAEWQAEHDSKAYARARAEAYASTGDQLDMQYHDLQDSTTTWADHVAEIKARFPK
jgi:hypothetical protein|tara:strand:+ start:425 stop:748 length:324 start_codon:yes stop_codon:yes gene_type:complete